jgi:hypothetical protein
LPSNSRRGEAGHMFWLMVPEGARPKRPIKFRRGWHLVLQHGPLVATFAGQAVLHRTACAPDPARPKRSPQHGCSPQPGAVGLGAVALGAVPGAVALGAVPGAVALGAVALTEVMPWLSGSSIDTSLVVVVLAVVIGRMPSVLYWGGG